MRALAFVLPLCIKISRSNARNIIRAKSFVVRSLIVSNRGVGTGGGTGGTCHTPPKFFQRTKVPFFVMKSALFVQANVAVTASKVAFLFGNFDAFKKTG